MNSVPATIQAQLGNVFFALMGASDLAFDATMLRFRIKGCRKISHLVVRLDCGADLYIVEAWKVSGGKRGPTIAKVAEVTDVFCEDLHRVIEDITGLATKF